MAIMRLVCNSPGVFAGVAVLITSMPSELAPSCNPTPPTPFFMIYGTADPLIPVQGGKAKLSDSKTDVLSAEATLEIFTKAAGCAEARGPIAIPDRFPYDGSRAYYEKWKGCKVPVEAIRVEGGGHTIPGRWSGNERGLALGAHNVDFDSPKVIWDFFHRFGV
jgi:polyhydroxybutyrate depolymerase